MYACIDLYTYLLLLLLLYHECILCLPLGKILQNIALVDIQTLGLENKFEVEIRGDALRDGDQVIVKGKALVSEGAAVNPVLQNDREAKQ